MPYKDPKSPAALASQSRRNATFHKNHREEILKRKREDYPRWYKDNKENILKSVKNYYQTYKGTFRYGMTQLKSHAKQRGKEFNLSMETLRRLYEENCFYCESETPSINIDRIDNTKGYVEGNVVSCCVRCNRVKGEMSVEELKAHLLKMLERL